MVPPLRFLPGLAGGLLLAYPRIRKAGSLRLRNMALRLRYFLAAIHPGPSSSMRENGISGTVRRLRYAGSMKYIYRS